MLLLLLLVRLVLVFRDKRLVVDVRERIVDFYIAVFGQGRVRFAAGKEAKRYELKGKTEQAIVNEFIETATLNTDASLLRLGKKWVVSPT